MGFNWDVGYYVIVGVGFSNYPQSVTSGFTGGKRLKTLAYMVYW